MLHIILLILKIIGIILAVILGILVLLIGIVLFVPVRYESVAKTEGEIKSLKGKVIITWLFHLVRVDILYKNQKMKWRVRLAWLKRSSGGVKEDENHEEIIPEDVEIEKEISEAIQELKAREETLKTHEKELEVYEEKWEESMEEIPERKPKNEKGSSGKRKSIGEKIQRFGKKITYTFRSICDKIRALLQKKDRLLDFLRDETHVEAFKKVKKELFAFLKRLNPKKLEANVRYGFEDPCRTGQVLAGFSMLYPFMNEHVNIIPDFEKQILKGNLSVKGKVYGYYFLILGWKLFWSKHVRTTYRHIRNFEL